MKGNRKRLIPFKWRNMLLGLSGDSYKKAEIEYHYRGPARERLLIELKYQDDPDTRDKHLLRYDLTSGLITQLEYDLGIYELSFDDKDSNEAKKRLLDVKHRHGLIQAEEYNRGMAALSDEPELEDLKLDFKYGKLTENEFNKRSAQLKGEPWVSINDVTFDIENPQRGAWVLDWNETMIEYLHEHGYAAPTEEETVNLWINDVCKNIALEAFDGVGNINEKLGDGSPEQKISDMNNIHHLNEGRYIKK